MTPGIPLAKLRPLVEQVWRQEGYQIPLTEAWSWSCPDYYRDTLGVKRGVNNDGIGFVSPNVDYRVLANCTPSIHRAGVATLRDQQVVWYKPGWHGYASIYGHAAFRQDSPVVVKRDNTEHYQKGTTHKKFGICLGKGYWTDLGFTERFWTNLHRQSGSGTSSLGCQTIPAATWKVFHAVVMSELARLNLTRFPCIILRGPIN